MKKVSTFATVTILALSLGLAGCKKKAADQPPPAPPPVAVVDAPPPPPPPEVDAAAAPTPDQSADKADYVKILAGHNPPKPIDPVEVTIEKVSVVKTDFDPAKVEGGKAEIELDLTSIKSNDPKRDEHLKTKDYIDVAKFGKATVKIDNVKKTGENAYTADANVAFHGVKKKLPVTFEVVETMPDGIRIKGEQKFTRADFKVGKAKGDGVADDLTVKLQLTLKKM